MSVQGHTPATCRRPSFSAHRYDQLPKEIAFQTAHDENRSLKSLSPDEMSHELCGCPKRLHCRTAQRVGDAAQSQGRSGPATFVTRPIPFGCPKYPGEWPWVGALLAFLAAKSRARPVGGPS